MKKTSLLFAVLITAILMINCMGGSNKREEVFNETDVSSNKDEVALNEVTINKQVWMVKNLNIDKFRNGDLIPEAKTKEEWKIAGENEQPAWVYYENNSSNGVRYGKLYNWYAVNDPRGLAPEGWRIPSDEDWNELTEFAGGKDVSGKKLKFTNFWADYYEESGNGTNDFGFSALPGGSCDEYGDFYLLRFNGSWWSSTQDKYVNKVYARYLKYYVDDINRDCFTKDHGFSVRCIKDL